MVVLEGGSVDETLWCDHPNEIWNFCLFFTPTTCEVKKLSFIEFFSILSWVPCLFLFVSPVGRPTSSAFVHPDGNSLKSGRCLFKRPYKIL